MAFHRELIKKEGRDHLILGLTAGNIAQLVHHEQPIAFAVDGLSVTLVFGRTPALAAEAMAKVRGE